MRYNTKGSAWIEIIVSIGALALLSVLGMRTLNLFIERLIVRQAVEQELTEIRGLGARLQRMFDQRRDDSFASVPGLKIEGKPVRGMFSLRRMEIQTLGGSGQPASWLFQESEGHWTEQLQVEEGPMTFPVRNLDYHGEILMHPDAISKDGPPEAQRWNFPGCRSQRAREGFVIYRFW